MIDRLLGRDSGSKHDEDPKASEYGELRAEVMQLLSEFMTTKPVIEQELVTDGRTHFDVNTVQSGWVIRAKLADRTHYWQIVVEKDEKKYLFEVQIESSLAGNERKFGPNLPTDIGLVSTVMEKQTAEEVGNNIYVGDYVKTFHPDGLAGRKDVDVTGILVLRPGTAKE